jgi:hypothetical protein
LEWLADKRAILKIGTLEELETKAKDLKNIIRIWIQKANNSFQSE